jgi:hypothetical protein
MGWDLWMMSGFVGELPDAAVGGSRAAELYGSPLQRKTPLGASQDLANIQDETGLPEDPTEQFKNSAGDSMNDLKVRYRAPKTAQLNTHAYAQGTNLPAAAAAPVQSMAEPTPAPNRTGMPDRLKTGIENLSGYSMDDVRVHYHSSKPSRLNALAYAQGSEIHLGSGQERHLPHEAWHVVQQAQGRVNPTLQAKGVAINDDKGLEIEATRMGQKALNFNKRSVVGERAETQQLAGAPIKGSDPFFDRMEDNLRLEREADVMGKKAMNGPRRGVEQQIKVSTGTGNRNPLIQLEVKTRGKSRHFSTFDPFEEFKNKSDAKAWDKKLKESGAEEYGIRVPTLYSYTNTDIKSKLPLTKQGPHTAAHKFTVDLLKRVTCAEQIAEILRETSIIPLPQEVGRIMWEVERPGKGWSAKMQARIERYLVDYGTFYEQLTAELREGGNIEAMKHYLNTLLNMHPYATYAWKTGKPAGRRRGIGDRPRLICRGE